MIGAVAVVARRGDRPELRIGEIVLRGGVDLVQQGGVGGVVNRLRQHVDVGGSDQADSRRSLIDRFQQVIVRNSHWNPPDHVML